MRNPALHRFLSLLLLLCMLMSLFPATAFAEGDSEAEAVLTAENAENEIVEAPEADEDAPAASIEEELFEAAEEAEPVEETEEAVPVEDAEPAAEPDAESYSIIYHINDGYTSSTTKKTHSAGADVSLNECSFTRTPSLNRDGSYCTCYALAGWNTSASGTGTAYALSDTLTMPAQDLDLYAVWAESEQVFWQVYAEEGGSLRYQPMKVSPGSDEWNSAAANQVVKVYVNQNLAVYSGTIHGFTPVPAVGYVFDGWYVYGTDMLAVEVLQAGNFPARLTSDLIDAGANRIVARFIKDDGNKATVTYQQDAEGTVVYYKQTVDVGSATPAIDEPHYKNHYFLGWSPDVSAMVTGDVTYVAQWMDGPAAGNVASPLFTIHCVNSPGYGGKAHEDMDYPASQFTSCDDIRYDSAADRYVCSVEITGIGVAIGVGPACYDVFSEQEHHKVDEGYPVIHLYWDKDDELWKPDGAQVVNVEHDTGYEPLTDAHVNKMSKPLCVTDENAPTKYKSLRLIPGTYEIGEIVPISGTELTTTVKITDFAPYAQALGADYEPDWETNLHEQSYYSYVFVRRLSQGSTAAGYKYYQWSDWNADNIRTEYQSTGGVKHNEFLYGKELLVKNGDVVWSFVDFTWTGDDASGYTAAVANFENTSGGKQTVAAVVTSETTAAGCETAGRTVYTATVSADKALDGEAHSDTKTVAVPALGHKWKFESITWAEDNTAEAVFVCENDASHTRTVAAVVTSETTAAGCETAGRTVYTATVSADKALDGVEHTDTRTTEIPATGHKWGEPDYVWAEDNGSVTASVLCENNNEHAMTETVKTSFAVTVEPGPLQEGTGVYTATFENALFTEQTKSVTLPAVELPAALTEAEIAAAAPVVNTADSSSGNQRSFGFLPGTYEAGEMSSADGLRYRTTVRITDLDAYAAAFGEGFYVAEDNPREAGSYTFVFVNSLQGDYSEGYAWSGWALDLDESGYTDAEREKGMELRVSDLYTVSYNYDLTNRFGEVYAETGSFEEVASYWKPVRAHYGDPIPALADEAMQSMILFMTGEAGFDGWDPAVQEGDTVKGDVEFVPKWVYYPDMFRFDYSGTDPYRSTAYNMDGALGRLICVTDEGHNVEIPARYWICLADGTRSSFSKEGDSWKGTITFRFNKYQWENEAEIGGFMATIVRDGYIEDGHKPVTPLSPRGFTTLTVDVSYDYETEKWSASELPEFELYCGYTVTYRDESGETLFYVKAGGGLPAYEGSTERDDGLFLGWFDQRGTQVVPGDPDYGVSGNTTVTATFLPYPDAEAMSNLKGAVFNFLCLSDPDEVHHPAVPAHVLADAGVKPAFGEITIEEGGFLDSYSVPMTLTGEQIAAILDYCASREFEQEAPAWFLWEKHELLFSGDLTVTLVFKQESYEGPNRVGAAPAQSDVSASNLLYGYWGLEDESAAEDLEIRCAYSLTFMDAEGEVLEIWPDLYLYYFDYDLNEYVRTSEEDLSLDFLPTNEEELEEFYGGDEEFLGRLRRDELHFGGWVLHDENGKELPLPAFVSEDLVLYPSYRGETCTVRFVVDGEEIEAVTLNNGETAAEPTTPEKKNYSFLGWFADGEDSPYDFSTPVVKDLTLTARFRHNPGWFKTENGEWTYYDADGTQHIGWLVIGKATYYLNEEGIMQTGWQVIDGETYWFYADGSMKRGWKKFGDDWYYFDDTGILHTGWLSIGKATYYLNEEGVMLTGWQVIDGETYWFYSEGYRKTGWKEENGAWYFFDDEGRMQRGWTKYKGDTFYLNADGKMQTGWKKLDGKWYFFRKSDGAMATGWREISSVWYYFESNGAMATGWKTIGGSRYYFQSSGAMQTGWLRDGGYWYWFSQSGVMAVNTTKTIDGKQYRFDAQGHMI